MISDGTLVGYRGYNTETNRHDVGVVLINDQQAVIFWASEGHVPYGPAEDLENALSGDDTRFFRWSL